MSTEIKVFFMGVNQTGKTCVIVKLIQDVFIPVYDQTVEDIYVMKRDIDGKRVQFTFQDLGGEEEYCILRDEYTRRYNTLIIMYSITDRESFTKAEQLFDNVHRIKGNSAVAIVLIGNKCDLGSERQVQTGEGKALAEKHNVPFFETSAQTGENLDEMLKSLFVLSSEVTAINANTNSEKKEKGCPVQ